MLTKEQKEVIKEYYESGVNPEDIAEEFGFDEMQVIDYCDELIHNNDLTHEFKKHFDKGEWLCCGFI